LTALASLASLPHAGKSKLRRRLSLCIPAGWQQITRDGRVLQGRANAAEVLPAEEGAEGAAATSV
jgi:hypothetical protein